ncbi:cytochrome c oxidase subunit 8A, mitochondrial-like [Betta splendens]|uniref:Cytochrome c oxidase subunit 8A, mitochondrial-like n=1 Tax=Betta splendens TaxID=158456 RepID=A0A6P7LJI0_BETSP|nr:cytochrome c oxidase subunit 8A, mitochondrial-like [Betta splendens]
MSGIIRASIIRGALGSRGHAITQRASYQSKPAKEKLGAVETSLAVGVLFLSIIAPSAWIMSHLEDYKSKK